MQNTTKNITVKMDRRHSDLLKQIAAKLGTTQKECLERIIGEHFRIMKQENKLKAKLRIEDMEPAEALVLLERKSESLAKTLDFIVSFMRTQEKEILNPLFIQVRTVSAQNAEIIEALKKLK